MAGGLSLERNIGEQITVRNLSGGVPPTTMSGSTVVSGGWMDRIALNDPFSCVVHVAGGAVTGAPTSAGLSAQLYHAVDNGSGTAPAATSTTYGSALAVTVTSGAAEASLNVDLDGANRWIQCQLAPTFSGGTSPTVPADVTVVFGGGQELPNIA